MKVYGHTVSDEQINSAFENVISETYFRCGDVIFELELAGVHRYASHRAADRFIQKWKKEGKIFYDKGNQCWRDVKFKN